MRKFKFAFAAMVGCATLLTVAFTSCNEEEKKEEKVETVAPAPEVTVPAVVDSPKVIDTAVPMPVKPAN